MNDVEKALELFRVKPYTIRMGAKKLSEIFKLEEASIREARATLKLKKSKKFKVPNILFLDIETVPMKAYIWARWKQNIYLDQTISEWYILCWSAKWLNKSKIYSGCLTPEEVSKEDDKRILGDLWTLLDQADIVVAHNGKKFDIPKINTRLIINGYIPPSPYKQIDTLDVALRHFKFSSNKLDALATYFGIENKDHTDFNLWVKCMKGDKKSLEYMLNYNIKDVLILEQVYIKLRPWIKNHPSSGLYTDLQNTCSICGSSNIILDEHYIYTNVNKYRVVRCLDCGGLSKIKEPVIPRYKNKKNLTSI